MASRRDPTLDRYLLDGERVVVALHHHWGRIVGPVTLCAGGLLLVLWVDAVVPASIRVVGQVMWYAWFALVVWTIWQLLAWRHDRFVATDKRLLLTYGLISQRVAMMPLQKVTDMSYTRSIPGRILGYGEFILESAGQDQALRTINWIPSPDHTYRAICAEMFGVPGDSPVLDDDADWPDEVQPSSAHWEPGSPVHEEGPHSRAIPMHERGADGKRTNPSGDPTRPSRGDDTGPIPIYPPSSTD